MANELFEKVPVHKAYFKLALPVVFSMVISLVYNMVDTWFIARTGNTDLIAGVSLGAPVFTLMIALGDIFGLGGSSVISRLFGRKLDEHILFLCGVCVRHRYRCIDAFIPASCSSPAGCRPEYVCLCFSILYLYRVGCPFYHPVLYALQPAADGRLRHSLHDGNHTGIRR